MRVLALTGFGLFGEHKPHEVRHAANLLLERSHLHQRHLKEIDRRHIEAQEKMFGAQINHTPDRTKRLSTLEGQLALRFRLRAPGRKQGEIGSQHNE